MGLKSSIGKALKKRIESMPSMVAATERAERLGPIRLAAQRAARSPLDDETAARTLAAELEADPSVLKEAAIEMSQHRADYLRDRAYRLLSAAVAGGPVQAMPPERVDLFAQEEALGRMPIEQAFDRLSELQPLLAELKRQARDGESGVEPRNRAAAALAVVRRVEAEHHAGVGPGHVPELVECPIAKSIVAQYLDLVAGTPGRGEPGVAYFENPRVIVY